jgi:hypothetical protein
MQPAIECIITTAEGTYLGWIKRIQSGLGRVVTGSSPVPPTSTAVGREKRVGSREEGR